MDLSRDMEDIAPSKYSVKERVTVHMYLFSKDACSGIPAGRAFATGWLKL